MMDINHQGQISENFEINIFSLFHLIWIEISNYSGSCLMWSIGYCDEYIQIDHSKSSFYILNVMYMFIWSS
jgi:hypothetical protein